MTTTLYLTVDDYPQLLEMLPMPDHTACGMLNMTTRLLFGDVLNCSGCGFHIDYKPNHVWILLWHIMVEHGMDVRPCLSS